jgi:hypothetical protein
MNHWSGAGELLALLKRPGGPDASGMSRGSMILRACHMWPEQLGWPQVQTISTLLAMPSQWALQYFDLSGGTQLQAAFAHFLELAMVLLRRPRFPKNGRISAQEYDAGSGPKGGTAARQIQGSKMGSEGGSGALAQIANQGIDAGQSGVPGKHKAGSAANEGVEAPAAIPQAGENLFRNQ